MTKLHIMEYGPNNKLFEENVSASGVPNVGDYIIADKYCPADWKDKMYIVRAVTRFFSDDVAVHVEKFNVDDEKEYWDNVVDKIRALQKGDKSGSEKSKEN